MAYGFKKAPPADSAAGSYDAKGVIRRAAQVLRLNGDAQPKEKGIRRWIDPQMRFP